jgi:hypothetical protein
MVWWEACLVDTEICRRRIIIICVIVSNPDFDPLENDFPLSFCGYVKHAFSIRPMDSLDPLHSINIH